MQPVFAQDLTIGGQTIKGPLQDANRRPITNLADVLNGVLTVLIPLASVILFLVLIWGGIDFILSRGDPEKIKGARAKITTSLIGFVLLVASYAIVRVIASVFGLGQGLF